MSGSGWKGPLAETTFEPLIGVNGDQPIGMVPQGSLDKHPVVPSFVPLVLLIRRNSHQLEDVRLLGDKFS